MKKTVFFLLAFLCSVSFIFAQDGSLDMTFNPDDKGFGDGTTLIGNINAFAIQNDGKIIAGGNFPTHLTVPCKSIARFLPDGSLDPEFLAGSGFDDEVKSIAIQPDGKIIIGGYFTKFNALPANRIVRLNADGSMDETFNTGLGFDGPVETIAIQTDGKILAGGDFLNYQAQEFGRIIRLSVNGHPDPDFVTEHGFNGIVNKILIQNDGKILIGGEFTSYQDTDKSALIRILSNGKPDLSFNPNLSSSGISPTKIVAIAVQNDDKIIISGNFETVGDVQSKTFARIHADGSLDTTFVQGESVNGLVMTIVIQPDEKILIGGYFTHFKNHERLTLARINTDGSLDESLDAYLSFHIAGGNQYCTRIIAYQNDNKIIVGHFYLHYWQQKYKFIRMMNSGSIDADFNAHFGFGKTGFDGGLYITAIQQDGKILAGGVFSNYFGFPTNNLVRLEKDGSIDETFNIGTGFNGSVSLIELQKDGKIMVGGNFTNFNGTDINRVLRLHPDGRLDESFDPGTGFENPVTGICIQEDGKILIGGEFTFYNGQFQKRLLRVYPDGTLDGSFDALFLDIRKIRAVTIHENKIYVAGSLGEPGIELSNQINRTNLDGKPDKDFNCGEEFLFISSLKVKSDGKILVAGRQNFWEEESLGLIQLNPNGLKDKNFANNNPKPPFNMYIIDKIIVDQNGKILLVSNLTEEVSSNFTRLNSDGSLDTTFNIGGGFDNYISTLAIQDDGNIIVGGGFTSYNGVGRNRIARLHGSTGVLIPETNPDQTILCYPNPTTGKVNIKLNKYYPDLSLTLVDLFGRTILQKQFTNTQNIELELSSQSGLYFVTLNSTDGWIKTIPVVKQ